MGERNKSFAVHDLSDIPIGELSFQNKQGEKIYCGDHFEKTYKLRVNRDLPAIVHSEKFKGEMKKSFYPMEVLQIEPGQRVNMQKSQFEPSLVSKFFIVNLSDWYALYLGITIFREKS